jgi:hypothetical protein
MLEILSSVYIAQKLNAPLVRWKYRTRIFSKLKFARVMFGKYWGLGGEVKKSDGHAA